MVLMKRKILKYLKEIVVFIIVLTVATNLMSLYRTQNLNISDEVCSDGSDFVHFWATWCVVCKTEASNIEFISKYYKVKTIAVKSGTNKEIQTYLKNNNLSFDFYNDINGDLASKYGINIFPTTITCKDKRVKFVDVGYTSIAGFLIRGIL